MITVFDVLASAFCRRMCELVQEDEVCHELIRQLGMSDPGNHRISSIEFSLNAEREQEPYAPHPTDLVRSILNRMIFLSCYDPLCLRIAGKWLSNGKTQITLPPIVIVAFSPDPFTRTMEDLFRSGPDAEQG